MNKKALTGDSIVTKLLWILFFIFAIGATYFLIKRFTT
tara:strand:+ start:1253 stop:1366 length:114 start_codon:yes stop_codon:yes gene_type:complete